MYESYQSILNLNFWKAKIIQQWQEKIPKILHRTFETSKYELSLPTQLKPIPTPQMSETYTFISLTCIYFHERLANNNECGVTWKCCFAQNCV